MKLEELNADEMNVVAAGVISPASVDHYEFNMQTGTIVAVDKDGNVIEGDPTVWY